MANRQPLALLMEAMTVAAVARGEAQWTNGYRALYEEGAFKRGYDDKEFKRLHEKELSQWKHVEVCEARFRRIAVGVIRKIAAGNGARAKLRRHGARKSVRKMEGR